MYRLVRERSRKRSEMVLAGLRTKQECAVTRCRLAAVEQDYCVAFGVALRAFPLGVFTPVAWPSTQRDQSVAVGLAPLTCGFATFRALRFLAVQYRLLHPRCRMSMCRWLASSARASTGRVVDKLHCGRRVIHAAMYTVRGIELGE
jgi:hypothetical protein